MEGRFTLAVIALTLAICCTGTAQAYQSRQSSFVVMTSARSDSSIVLEIEDGGYAYERVEGLIGASIPCNYTISVNGNEVRSGLLNPETAMFIEYRLNLAAGNSTINVQIGQDSYYYSLRVINRSYEDQVLHDNNRSYGPVYNYMFKDLIKVFVATFTGIAASFICVFIWVKDKLTQDIRVVL